MTGTDPITAIVDQLAAHAEQLTRLDTREADHHAAVSARLAELTGQTAALGHVVQSTLPRSPGSPHPARPTRRRRVPPRASTGVVEADRRRPAGTHRPAAGLGRAGLPARLRAPGRHPRPLLARPRPVPVRTRHRVRAVVGAVPAARPQPRPAVRPGRIPGPHPARPGRPAPRRDQHLRPPPQPRTGRRPALEQAMTDATLRQALAFAARGWPVFPCQPGQKDPGHPARLPRRHHRPSSRSPPGSAATPTGTWPSPPAPPDPTSWTSTSTARPGTGTPPSPSSAQAGLLDGAAAYVRTPSGGLHAYFPAPTSATATCPTTTWTSAPAAATSSPRPPRSTASPTS